MPSGFHDFAVALFDFASRIPNSRSVIMVKNIEPVQNRDHFALHRLRNVIPRFNRFDHKYVLPNGSEETLLRAYKEEVLVRLGG